MSSTSIFKKILFADDDDAFRFTIKEYFADSPWTIDMAENGVVALDKALACHYDLIILDINMPFMKGNETVKEIKKKWPKVRVLAFTAYASHDVIDQYLKDGFDDVISKHTDLDLFQKIISQHLRMDSPAQESAAAVKKETDLAFESISEEPKQQVLSSEISDFSIINDGQQNPSDFLIKRIQELEQEKNALMEENLQLKQRIAMLQKLIKPV